VSITVEDAIDGGSRVIWGCAWFYGAYNIDQTFWQAAIPALTIIILAALWMKKDIGE
jgi:hypothetical protein